ncbi:MAG: hypothetical protein M1834_000486 [Cirrosporium novae-zelandiae]|nr:MAG: hypothetical protein M1834_000486 [Cirrosporium novae-zelandiae]
MPHFTTSQDWLRESSLLIQAHPTTTRITTKYNVEHPSKAPPSKKLKTKSGEVSTPSSDPAQPVAAKGSLTLKTFDPKSGICLKYKTDKGAEVGRLMASLGRLGRTMAGLPEMEDNIDAVEDKMDVDEKQEAAPPAATTHEPNKGGHGKGGKKKKGKR